MTTLDRPMPHLPMVDTADMSAPAIRALERLPARIEEVTANSREVKKGWAFLAYPGLARDGREFIEDAIERGAGAIIFDADHFVWNEGWKIPHVGISNLKAVASHIAGHVYQQPSKALWMAGVTGTNGKTSVSQWIAHARANMGARAAVIGTIGNGLIGDLRASDNTTPDAVTLQRRLREFLRAGASACAMEVSSHGLDQGRVADVHFNVGVFTNLTRDHLDYHGTMQAYGAAKAKLFATAGMTHAVVNVDDEFGRTLAAFCAVTNGLQLIRYGVGPEAEYAELRATNIRNNATGIAFDVYGAFGNATVQTCVLGTFNVSNLLAVLGALIAGGANLATAAKAVNQLKPVQGRMQTVRVDGKPLVVVDYAHTPDALEKALSTLRQIVPAGGKLISVFGCGGDRDRGKRAMMAAVSSKWANLTILTSDNPRTEDPIAIIRDIEAGMGAAPYRTQVERDQAIYEALNAAGENDIVLLAGKGHEDYQVIGTQKQHFSDVEVAEEALATWKVRRA